MISVSHLTKQYGDHRAVDDISFEVDTGEVVGLLGPNGAGKTTTIRILSGFLAATAGTVHIGGHDVRTHSLQVRRQIGYLPESVPLYPEMRVDEYLRFRAAIKGVRSQRLRVALSEAKERCGLQQMGRTLIGHLSRGYRQRVGLADALIHNPALLILDEPTLGLDPNQNREVRELIRQLAQRHTVLLCTHILPEVEITCSRVLILNKGRIAASDTPGQLRADLGGGNRLRAQIKGPRGTVEVKLNTLPHVRRVRIEEKDGWLYCRVRSARELDLRPNVFDLAAQNGWSLRELTSDNRSLEDIYLGITQDESAGGAHP